MNSVGLFLNRDGKMEILGTLSSLTDLNHSQVNYCSPAAVMKLQFHVIKSHVKVDNPKNAL